MLGTLPPIPRGGPPDLNAAGIKAQADLMVAEIRKTW